MVGVVKEYDHIDVCIKEKRLYYSTALLIIAIMSFILRVCKQCHAL